MRALSHAQAGQSRLADYRHSDGAYFASRLPPTWLPRPRLTAVAVVVLPQAQSIAPCDAAVGMALFTFGVNTIVWLFSPVGIPLPAVARTVTWMSHGDAAVAVTFVTNLLAFSGAGLPLMVPAAAVRPAVLSVWNASLIRPLNDEPAITASDNLARTV